MMKGKEPGMLEKLPDNIKEYIKQSKRDLLDGYIRFLGEEEISAIDKIIQNSSIWEGGLPFATTAFGDVFVWDGGYILLYKFTEVDHNVILSGSTFFFENVDDSGYQKDFFDIELYILAVNKYGKIDHTECYTLEPIPALGGLRELSYVHIGDMKTYLKMVIELE